jgi:hypothetical protein
VGALIRDTAGGGSQPPPPSYCSPYRVSYGSLNSWSRHQCRRTLQDVERQHFDHGGALPQQLCARLLEIARKRAACERDATCPINTG